MSRAAQHASELKAANRRAVEAQNVGDSANRRAAATYSNVTSTMAQLETKIFEYKDSLNAKNKEIGRLQARQIFLLILPFFLKIWKN